MNAIRCVAENGCRWRALPRRFGNRHTSCTRTNRWAKAGVPERSCERRTNHEHPHGCRRCSNGPDLLAHARRSGTRGGNWPRCRIRLARVYEGEDTRQLVLDPGFTPVVPPPGTRIGPWRYGRARYDRHYEVDRGRPLSST